VELSNESDALEKVPSDNIGQSDTRSSYANLDEIALRLAFGNLSVGKKKCYNKTVPLDARHHGYVAS
jgi:hypothetical protein